VIDQGSVVLQQVVDQFVDRCFPEPRCFLKVADDLASENPQVVDMFLNGLL
jgi:hypothetical protein